MFDAAVAELREAIRLKPGNAEDHHNLGAALVDQGKLDEALAAFHEAIRLKPGNADGHCALGAALEKQGKLIEAAAECREAIRLKPDHAEAHYNLGVSLERLGNRGEAMAEYREAIRLKPEYYEARNNLGGALLQQGKPDAAVAEFREAIRLKPDHAMAHANLGIALRSRGDFVGQFAELRKARDLGRNSPTFGTQLERELAATERQASLAHRLQAVLAGKVKPADAAESLAFAQLCHRKELYGSSARFWAGAFQAQPGLADDMQAQHRYNAACAAALAGCGQGKDNPPLDESAKARCRKQAIDWLKADLAVWSKVLEKGPPAARQAISQTLQHWKVDSDLAGLRDAAALAKLPHDEQKAYRALWADVGSLLATPGSTSKP